MTTSWGRAVSVRHEAVQDIGGSTLATLDV